MNAIARWMRNLRWWVLDYAYAAYWWVHALFSRLGPDSFRAGTGRTVVIVPGVYETWRFLQPIVERVHATGHPVHVLDFPRMNSRPVAEAAEQVCAYLEEHDLRGVTIVAHSKGGLIGKYVMSMPEGAERVDCMLAVASPFSGSRYARYMLLPSLRIFRPHDRTIMALAEQQAVNSRIVSVYGRFDPHIPEGSELPGAKNVELDTGGHFRVLDHPRVMGELAVLLERRPGA